MILTFMISDKISYAKEKVTYYYETVGGNQLSKYKKNSATTQVKENQNDNIKKPKNKIVKKDTKKISKISNSKNLKSSVQEETPEPSAAETNLPVVNDNDSVKLSDIRFILLAIMMCLGLGVGALFAHSFSKGGRL